MRSIPFLVIALLLAACEGPLGPAGPGGDPGDPGNPGDLGDPGDPGVPGRDTYLTDPGLVVDLTAAELGADGFVTATVKITDRDGTPLDRDGRYTTGPVSLSFVLAHLAVDAD